MQDQSILRAMITAMESDLADPSRMEREIAALEQSIIKAQEQIAALRSRRESLPAKLAQARRELQKRTQPDLDKAKAEILKLREALARHGAT